MQKSFKKPCPVSGLLYPTSEAELDEWAEQTIQSEINRGRFLQEKKSLDPERSNAVYIRNPKLVNSGINERRKSSKWSYRRSKARSPTSKSPRMSNSTSRDGSVRTYRSSRMDRPACSMRISELAVPTKRQCIASWRANANILPENMINRLKQRVTDQTPIVKVSDAVNCMKQNKRYSQNSDVISPVKRPSRKINKEAMYNRIHAENRLLSEAFGIKIAQRLMRPIAITLNSQLQNISNVVSEEIYKVIKNKITYKTDKADKELNKRMLREVSEKVTIWIGKILDDSTEKLLEEELEVLQYRPMISMGRLVTLIEVTTHEESELEEQEGPVLDILDDIVDTIIHKCVRTPSDTATPEYLSISSKESVKHEGDRHSTDEKLSQSDNIITAENFSTQETSEISPIKVNKEDTVENDIKKQLNDVIESLGHNSLSNDKINDSIQRNEYDEDTIENLVKEQLNQVINTLKQDDSEISSAKIGDSFPTETYPPDNEEKHSEPEVKLEPDIDVLYTKDDQSKVHEEQNYRDEQYDQNISANEDMSDTGDQSKVHEERNYDDQNISENEDMSDTGDLNSSNEEENNVAHGIEENSSPMPSVNEATGSPILQNEKTDDNNVDDGIPLESDVTKVIDDIDDIDENATDRDKNEEQTSNVSDAIEIITDGLSEEKNKTVKFSNENLDPMKENKLFYQIISRENIHFEDEQLLASAANFERPNINFAPPNDHLLSGADEPWPDNPPVTKPSASVTRSISSMGKILESDEKLSIASDDDANFTSERTNDFQSSQDYHENNDDENNPNSILSQDGWKEYKNDDQQEVNDLQKKRVDLANLNEISTPTGQDSKQVAEDMQTDGSSFIVQETFEPPALSVSQNQNMSLVELEQDISENMQKEETITMIEKDYLEDSSCKTEPEVIDFSPPDLVAMLSNWQKYDNRVSSKKLDVSKYYRSKATEHTEDSTVYGQTDQIRVNSEETPKKFDYRVHPKTAPAWIRRGQGDLNAHRSPCACRPLHHSDTNKMKEREREILKRCRDLDYILLKLDKWKNWLNFISKYITTLKHKTAYNGNGTVKHKLPVVTEKDITWSKLNQRAKGGLEPGRRHSAVKLEISPSPVKFCTTCGRKKSNRIKKQHRGHSKSFLETKRKKPVKFQCLNRNQLDVSS